MAISHASDVDIPALDSTQDACAIFSAAMAMSVANRESFCSEAVTIADVRKRVTARKRPKSGGTMTESASVFTDRGDVAVIDETDTKSATKLFAGSDAKNLAR